MGNCCLNVRFFLNMIKRNGHAEKLCACFFLRFIKSRKYAIIRAVKKINGGDDIMEKSYWEGKHFSYFSNKECEYFPCHKGADSENFNCLFCYCPLYALGENCGGNFRFTENGIKDCTECQVPHKKQNYGYITGKYQELAELIKKQREE